jgi:hypothetical protein
VRTTIYTELTRQQKYQEKQNARILIIFLVKNLAQPGKSSRNINTTNQFGGRKKTQEAKT